jgi:hypothetical protein
MPIPGSDREKKFLSEINEKTKPQFLQEIKEPTHDKEKRLRKSKWKRHWKHGITYHISMV